MTPDPAADFTAFRTAVLKGRHAIQTIIDPVGLVALARIVAGPPGVQTGGRVRHTPGTRAWLGRAL